MRELLATPSPWSGIRPGLVQLPVVERSFREGLESPCVDCVTSPCCTYLPLQTFRVHTVSDLSHATYLLNFDHIRLGLSQAGDWNVYYAQPCRHLDLTNGLCTLRGTPDHPHICAQYDPHTCWYRRNIPVEVGEAWVQIDHTRLQYILDRTTVDELRDITSMPTWDELREAFLGLHDPPEPPYEPVPDPAYDAWEAVVHGDDRLARRLPMMAVPEPRGLDELGEPCDDCSAPCCETVQFPQELPTTRSHLDFLQFALGFPGVELSVTDAGWWLVVRTRCRHLAGGRCGIYGEPERPLECVNYDAYRCTYRVEYGFVRPPGAVRIRKDHYPAVLECLTFDGLGNVVAIADVETIRSHVEEAWRSRSEGSSMPAEPAPVRAGEA